MAPSRSSSSRKASALKASGPNWTQRTVYDGRPYYVDLSMLPRRTLEKALAADDLESVVSLDKPEQLQSKEEKARRAGRSVWVPHASEVWQIAKELSKNADGSVTVQPDKGAAAVVPANGALAAGHALSGAVGRTLKMPLWDVSWSTIDWVADDIIQIDGINEAAVMFNLKKRYDQNTIYTWITGGSVLLSVNPYKQIPELYSADTMRVHKSTERNPNKSAPPHVYNVANAAYEQVRRTGMAQSILVSGESGTGKTEATKQMLEFLAETVGGENKELGISERLVLSNPLLEAFGNSATSRNNNSSRFGKFIKVFVGPKSGQIVGASFRNFMLESTRVVRQQEGDRGYHVFYYILQDAQLRKELGLGAPKDYAYLAGTKSGLRELPEDKENFAKMRKGLDFMGFSATESMSIFRVLAGLLLLGNVKFRDVEQKSRVMGSEVIDDAPVRAAAEFLQVDAKQLGEVCVARNVTARGETARVVFDAKAARDSTDALVKIIYNSLFNSLVTRVNAAMAPPGGEDRGEAAGRWLGMLDIFGFENLGINSFEQLCINYCNERLVQHSNQYTFVMEEQFYKEEGVEHKFLKPKDLSPSLEAMDRRAEPLGLLVALDDESTLATGTDEAWISKSTQRFKGSQYCQFDVKEKMQAKLSFQVIHYAGRVRYDAEGFVVKNRDTAWANQYALCQSSKDAIMRACFPKEAYSSDTKPISFQYRKHVNDLLTLIAKTGARFIRCVKPNWDMKPNTWDAPMVQEQLKNAACFEILDIGQGGFPFRHTHKQFAFQFKCINPRASYDKKLARSTDYKALCAAIIAGNKRLQANISDLRLGNAHVLYRVSQHRPLVLMRAAAIERNMPSLQAVVRGGAAREYHRRLRACKKLMEGALAAKFDLPKVRAALANAKAVKKWVEPCLAFLPAFPLSKLEKQCEALEDKLVKAFAECERRHALCKELLEAALKAQNDLALCRRALKECADAVEFAKDFGTMLPLFPHGALQAEAQALLRRLEELAVVTDEMAAISAAVKRPADLDVARYKRLDVLVRQYDKLVGGGTKPSAEQARLYDRCGELMASVRAECERLQREAKELLVAALKAQNDLPLVRRALQAAAEAIKFAAPFGEGLPPFPAAGEKAKVEQLEQRLEAMVRFVAEIAASCAKVGKPSEMPTALFWTIQELVDRFESKEWADVKATAEQERTVDAARKLLRDSPQGTLEERAKAAIKTLARPELQAVEDDAKRLKFDTPSSKKCSLVLERMRYLDEEAREALDCVDGARMHACVTEAALYHYSNDALKQIEKLFKMPEEDFVKMELDAAIRLKDTTRAIHRRIRLKEIFYDKMAGGSLDRVWETDKARPAQQFAAMAGGLFAMCSRDAIRRGMQSFSPKPLPATLAPVPGESVGKADPPEIKKLKAAAKKNFANIQTYMGDKKAKTPAAVDQAGEAVLAFGRDAPQMRNEVYLQLIKQLTNNPSAASVAKGYELLGVCTAQFLPTESFEDNLVMWIRKNPGPTNRYKTYTSALHVLQFSGDAKDGKGAKKPINELRQDVERMAKEGSRLSIPKEAFTGPTNAKKPQPRGSVLRTESIKTDPVDEPQDETKRHSGSKKKHKSAAAA